MSNPNDVETKRETEEKHVSESCCIVYRETKENDARKFVRKCHCSLKNVLFEEFYHHSDLCEYFRRKYYGGCIIKMICYCEGPHRSYHR